MQKKFIISNISSAREALIRFNQLDESASVLVVVDENEMVIGTLTDGDIRRGLLRDLDLNSSVQQFMNKTFYFLFTDENLCNRLDTFKKKKIRFIPQLDSDRKFVSMVDLLKAKIHLPVDAIIMAGGRGERLKPLTDSIPKPLLYVGDKPIIEHNIDLLVKYGVKKIFVTIRYLGEQIETFLGDGSSKNTSISYISEKDPLGTAGAARLIEDFSNDSVLLMNSDILTNINLTDFYNAFRNSLADFAVATVPYNVNVPFAVMEIDEKNGVNALKEKPVYTYYSNAGIYLIKTKMLNYIPLNQKFDATDLMELLIKKNHKVISFPIMAYWLDIGMKEDYQKAQDDIKQLIF